MDIFINKIKAIIEEHQALIDLKYFGDRFIDKQLTAEQLRVFFATLWAFFKETPSGILSLSLRLSDYWRNIDPWSANAQSAHLLYANIDEFGLQDFRNKIYPTHHQMFKLTAERFNVNAHDLQDEGNALEAGRSIGEASFEFYRNKPVSVALGFHLASEFTSGLEFKFFFDGFKKNMKFYNINDNSDLEFFEIHTQVEPYHLLQSIKLIISFIEKIPDARDDIIFGINAYMNFYQCLFSALNKVIIDGE